MNYDDVKESLPGRKSIKANMISQAEEEFSIIAKKIKHALSIRPCCISADTAKHYGEDYLSVFISFMDDDGPTWVYNLFPLGFRRCSDIKKDAENVSFFC